MRRPEEARPRAPQPRGKHPHRHRQPETPVSRPPAAPLRRRPAQPHLRPSRDRIRQIRTHLARNLPRRIRIIRTRTPITRAQVRTQIPTRRDRLRIRARPIPVLPTQARIPALRIPVPIRVRIIQGRRTQRLRIRRRGIRLPAAAPRRNNAGRTSNCNFLNLRAR